MHSMKLIRKESVYVSALESPELGVSGSEIPYLYRLIGSVSIMVSVVVTVTLPAYNTPVI
jgi:hypothetical protein